MTKPKKRKPKRSPRGRVPRPVRRTGTEVMADVRTNRLRDRGQAERAAVEAELLDEGFGSTS